MQHTIFSNIRQAILSKICLISIIGFAVVIFVASIEVITESLRSEELLANGFHATLITTALSSEAITLALPIICALPYTTSFIDDIKSGFIKEYLPRTTVKSYLLGKILACYLSGGLVIVCGIFLAYGISALIFAPMEAALEIDAAAPQYFSELAGKCLPFFFTGGFLSILGMLIATLTNSKYMAYASPFIVYYVLIILKERYLDSLYVIYPKEWLNPSGFWLLGNWSVILFLLECTIVVSLCFFYSASGRLKRI